MLTTKHIIMAKQKEKDPCWSGYEQAGTKKKRWQDGSKLYQIR